MSTAERNRAIKKTLEQAFGRGKVRVRGDRGTAYGWVHVNIDWTPLNNDQAREMKGHIWDLLRASKLAAQIGTYGYDDPGSDYGFGSKCSIDFNPPHYWRTQRMESGKVIGLIDAYSAHWEVVS